MTDTPQTTPEGTQEPIKAPALPFTIHATLKDYRRRLGAWRLVIAAAVTLIILVRFGILAWLISLVVIGLIVAGIITFFARRSVTVTSEGLEYKNLFRTRKVSYSDLEGAKVFINYYDPAFGTMPRVSIAQKSGTEWLTLVGMFWPAEELDKLVAALYEKKVEIVYYEDPATYAMIAKQFPAYATYIERHPGKIVAISLAVIIIGIFGVAAFITFAL